MQPPQKYDGKVNVEDFWESVSLEMVSRGLVPSKYELHPEPEFVNIQNMFGVILMKIPHVLQWE